MFIEQRYKLLLSRINKKQIGMLINIIEPSTKNGKPYPPMLYRNPPIAGPRLKPSPVAVSIILFEKQKSFNHKNVNCLQTYKCSSNII